MKILVADDDSVVRTIVARVASDAGYELVEAENGLDAIEALERDDPDVLITDLRMPVLDGFELVQTVRASVAHRAMPIVCLSSVSDREAIMRLAEMGITDYVLKPIKPRDLADRLRAVVAKHGSWKAGRDARVGPTEPPSILVIDPDLGFHGFVESALSPDFTVLSAPSGAAGVTTFRARTPRMTAVLIAEGLQLLDEQRVAALLRRLAADDGIDAPTLLLVSAEGAIGHEKAAAFDGVIQRSLVLDDFLAATAQWLPKPSSAAPAESVGEPVDVAVTAA
ncbi:MAG TPA: response regulator [Gemmatimonadaceae bacterium]|nr:response regulator [Gemmatimonadaceae bacterium]